MEGAVEVFQVDGGWGFRIWIAPQGRDKKPFPWDGRSWSTRREALEEANKSPWIAGEGVT